MACLFHAIHHNCRRRVDGQPRIIAVLVLLVSALYWVVLYFDVFDELYCDGKVEGQEADASSLVCGGECGGEGEGEGGMRRGWNWIDG